MPAWSVHISGLVLLWRAAGCPMIGHFGPGSPDRSRLDNHHSMQVVRQHHPGHDPESAPQLRRSEPLRSYDLASRAQNHRSLDYLAEQTGSPVHAQRGGVRPATREVVPLRPNGPSVVSLRIEWHSHLLRSQPGLSARTTVRTATDRDSAVLSTIVAMVDRPGSMPGCTVVRPCRLLDSRYRAGEILQVKYLVSKILARTTERQIRRKCQKPGRSAPGAANGLTARLVGVHHMCARLLAATVPYYR
jgi:hypothetical protein